MTPDALFDLTPALGAFGVLDPEYLIRTFGTFGLFAIVFAETGLLLGFFLPGDSLLFTAGVLSATSASAVVHLDLAVILPGLALAAILGAQTGYTIGRRAGPMLFDRPDSRLFKREYVVKAEYYLDRFGAGKAVVLARFVPVVRTFLNPAAGVVRMPARTFAVWNVVGGVLWTVGVTLLGYFLGRAFNVDRYLLPAVAVVVVVSLIPVAVEVVKARRTNREERLARGAYDDTTADQLAADGRPLDR